MKIILHSSSASVLRKTNELLIAWVFATGSSGDLGIFASRDGATSAKWVLNFYGIVEDSVIMSSFTLSFSWGFDDGLFRLSLCNGVFYLCIYVTKH